MTKHEEVIIDGDSTDEEEEEVRIITPESRKRRRRSHILIDQDEEEGGEEEEDEEEKTNDPENKAVSTLSSVPRRQQLLHLGRDGISAQYMTLRTPTPVRRSHRNLQQLSISAAVARGDRGRSHQHEEDEKNDDDDDVCIVHPPSVRSETRNGSTSRRAATQDGGEELVSAKKEQDEQQNSERENVDTMSSASRRSSRIQHHRQGKEAQHGIARKLAYPVLDNCLDNIQSVRPHYQNHDDEEEEEESEPEEAVAPPPQKRRRSLPREGERDDREKVYADGGEDVHDFICDDDEIEYMDDDEEGVISVEASDNEMEGDPEELTAMLAAGRSREICEWFSIYLAYLEECIIDPEFENKMGRKRSKAKHQLYGQAVNRIERKLCSCRDSVRSGVAWPEQMVDALKCASLFRTSHVSADQDCEVCNRRQHVATCHVELAGMACDATKFYGHNWMRHLKETTQEAAPVQITFEMGSVCHARTSAYWQLLHAKQFWCILVDAKLKECADSTGRIPEQYRNEFFTTEFGRYKRLVGLVEKFAEDSKQISVHMPNVWKRIIRRNTASDFLPLPSRASMSTSAESRRGTLDAFVAESEEEDAKDEEAMMEKREEKQRADTCGSNDDDQATDEKKKVKGDSPLGTPHSEKKQKQNLQLATKRDDEKGGSLVKGEEDIDDLMCLVCNASQRDAGVVHGLYLHVYCCYACVKRQYRMNSGCLVCNRPIDHVLRLLPLTLDARNAIRNQKS